MAIILKFYYSKSMLPIGKRVGKLIIVASMLCVLLLTAQTKNSFAQSPDTTAGSTAPATLGVARIIEMKEENVKDGSIVSQSEEGPILSNTAYDSQIQGVVARDAGILLSDDGSENGIPIISVGRVYVLVSTIAGNIKKGDLITTTSHIPGVGVKAIKSGYVIGTALEDYENPNTEQVEKIAVDLNMHYFNAKPTFPGTLSDIFKLAVMPTKEGPTALYKYIVAAMVTIASFVLGFLTFGRTAAKGVEALGRNPAAGKIIHLGIIFNVTIVIFIALAGLTVAFLILRL
jgi:F0F1-type ATP synthase membrane subunit c/vacuolar-type H+-ATPase subunit K